MESLLLLLLVAFMTAIVNYYIAKSAILFPGFICSVSWLICIIIACFSASITDTEVSYTTVGIIAGSLISFSLGSYLADKMFKIQTHEISNKNIHIKNIYIILFFVLSLLTTYLQIDYLKRVSYLAGGYSGIFEIFSVSRTILNSDMNTERMPLVLIFGKILINSFACISLFAYFYNNNKTIALKKYLIVPTMYILLEFISTNRNGLLMFIMYSFAIQSIIQIKIETSKTNKKNTFSLVKKSIESFAFLFILFFLAGMLTNKVQSINIFTIISTYTGDAIIAFDKVVSEEFVATRGKYWGQGLFNFVYTFLYLLPMEFERTSSHLNMVYWNGGATNIFTSLLYYWEYFGIIGCIAFNLIIGLFFGYLYKTAIVSNKIFYIVLYGYIFYIIPYIPIAERFFSYLLTVTGIGSIFILYKFCSFFY